MIKKCLFPAAGYGTRFLPATKAIPKEMLPVNAKPLIQYGIEEALNAKCGTMAIVTGRGKRAIEDHFDASYELEAQLKDAKKEHFLQDINDIIANCTFTYTRQKAMRGLGDAILTGESLIGGEAFGVILADDLCINENGNGVLAQMAELYAKYRCAIVAIMEVPKNELNKYGVIDGIEIEEGIFEIKSMIEKPEPKDAPSNLAVIGRYILTPDIFSILRYTKPDKKGEIQITDALNKQAQISRVLAYKFKGIRYDCGSVEGFVRANNELFYADSAKTFPSLADKYPTPTPPARRGAYIDSPTFADGARGRVSVQDSVKKPKADSVNRNSKHRIAKKSVDSAKNPTSKAKR